MDEEGWTNETLLSAVVVILILFVVGTIMIVTGVY